MNRRSIVTLLAGTLVLAGISIGGYSVAQIRQMNSNSGSQVLPELAHFPTKANTVRVNRAGQTPPTSSQQDPYLTYVNAHIKTGDYLGTISIPALKKTLPIYEGTDDAQLRMGVGHYEGSVLPGINDNSVLAGHRDSTFTNFGKLRRGDLIIVTTVAGRFVYKISGFRIVMPDDRTVIVPTKSAVLTLSTCYPFRYFGNAPKRFIVSANLLP